MGQSFLVSFSQLRGAWNRNRVSGQVWGQPRLGHSPGEVGDLLVGLDLLVRNAYFRVPYSTVYFGKVEGNGNWRLALTLLFSGLLWSSALINSHREPKHRERMFGVSGHIWPFNTLRNLSHYLDFFFLVYKKQQQPSFLVSVVRHSSQLF